MISFSIDYLTRNDDRKIECESDGSFAGTPSPQKDISPGHSDSDQSCCENTEAIAEVLLSLDKTIKNGLVDEQCSEKPPHSYIALISMAILSNKDRKMLLSDIYQYIMDNFQYYNNSEKAWRNSIRHNLSLNECFVKNGRSDNGKGNFWSIHPACVEDFARGDFRRRQARRRARKGLKDVNFQHGNPDISGRNCRYNFGYVPMTSSTVGYHPFAHQMYIPPSSYNCAPYPAPATPPTGFYPSTNTQQSQQTNMPSLTPCRFQGW